MYRSAPFLVKTGCSCSSSTMMMSPGSYPGSWKMAQTWILEVNSPSSHNLQWNMDLCYPTYAIVQCIYRSVQNNRPWGLSLAAKYQPLLPYPHKCDRIWEKGPLGAERQFLVSHNALMYSSWASYYTWFCVCSCFHCWDMRIWKLRFVLLIHVYVHARLP